MPFVKDPTLTMQLSGSAVPYTPLTSAATSMANTATETPKEPGFIGSLAKSIWSDITDYPKMAGEALYQGGRVLLDPKWREIVQKTNSNQELTPEEAQYVLKSSPDGAFLKKEELDKFKTLKSGLLEGSKRTAKFASYIAPAAIGTPGVAAGSFRLGAPAMTAGKALMYTPTGLGVKGMAQLMGRKGLISGALQGYGTSETGQELASTGLGAGLGLATGTVMGALTGKLQQKAAQKALQAKTIQEGIYQKPVGKAAGGTFGSIWDVPTRKGYSHMDTTKTGQQLMDLQIHRYNKINSYETLDDLADEALDTLRPMVEETLAKSRGSISMDDAMTAASKELQKRGLTKMQTNEILNAIQTSMGVYSDQWDDQIMVGLFKKNLGLTPENANKAYMAHRAVRDMAGQMGAQLDDFGFQAAYTNALKSLGFDDAMASQIAVTSKYGLIPGGVHGPVSSLTPIDALKSSQNLGLAAADLFSDSYYAPKDPLLKAKYSAFRAANDAIKKGLDRVTQMEMVDPTSLTPERLARLEKVSPKLASKVLQSPTVGGWRSLMAPFISAKEASYLTAKEGGRALRNQMLRNISSVLGAIGGTAIGGVPGLLAGLGLGTVGGPMLVAPAMRGAEALRVPATMKVAQTVQNIAGGGYAKAAATGASKLLNTLASGAVKTVPVMTKAVREAIVKDQQRRESEGR